MRQGTAVRLLAQSQSKLLKGLTEGHAEKGEADTHLTRATELFVLKKCQSYFQRQDNCGDI
jgi:hypothetical protein